MKKRIFMIAAVAVLFGIFFLPVPRGSYDDGGTREYKALAYKIVAWNKMTEDGVYDKTRVYFGKDRGRSIDELWIYESDEVEQKFSATVIEIKNSTATVEPLEGESERQSSDRITFGTSKLENIGAKAGSVVDITYTGSLCETYPATLSVKSWALSKNLRNLEYTEKWIDKTEDKKTDSAMFSDITITEIYSNCFFARPVIPMLYQIKLNGTLSGEWCVGDTVTVEYTNVYYDEVTNRIEADFSSVSESDFKLEEGMCYKPVIYLYPEKKTDVSVKLDLDGKLSCTYPEYKTKWQVTAYPDGTLKDKNGMSYNYLYWEGQTNINYDFSEGFCIKGEDTAVFLEYALDKLGLERREANEFIVYWLPLMQNNPYNLISFQTDGYTDAARLDIAPEPDTLIRVFMTWYSSDEYVEIENQVLKAPERDGFTAVEWGGTEIIK